MTNDGVINLRLPKELKFEFQNKCELEQIETSEKIRQWINEYVESEDGNSGECV